MTDRPVVGEVAEDLYAALSPAMTDRDEENDWALLWFLGGLGVSMQAVWDLVQADDSYDGWLRMLDPDTAPEIALGYLGQYAGAELQPGWTEQEKRDAIKTPSGFRRGAPAAFIQAVQRTLTGTKTVTLEERYTGEAYQMNFDTLEGETPDTNSTIRSALSAKPAGLQLYYGGTLVSTEPGMGPGPGGDPLTDRDYADVDADHASYTSLETEGTYEDVRLETP